MYLITGVNGFVGRALAEYLVKHNLAVRGTLRSTHAVAANVLPQVTYWSSGDINAETEWRPALQGVEILFHLAGTVHRPDIKDPNVYFTSIVQGTENLARQAAELGVKRLVYLSTSHVYGVKSSAEPIAETHVLHPDTPYAQAKLAAENLLLEIAQKIQLEIVIVRPPLVYGPGVKGNFAQLIQLVKKIPLLPFGGAQAKRSFVGIDNLIAFLLLCGQHPAAAHKIFNISDDQDISTRELCIALTKVMGVKRVLLPIPERYMQIILSYMRKSEIYEKLFQSVCLNINAAKNILGWYPLFSVEAQLAAMFISAISKSV